MNRIFVEGHRGFCAKYPENTLASFRAALDLKIDAIEFDIWLSKDKVPVLMHDGNCKRTCGYDRHLDHEGQKVAAALGCHCIPYGPQPQLSR